MTGPTDLPKGAKVGTSTKLYYGSGQAVDAIVQAIVNTFLLFYLTAVCGMSGAAAGSIFLISLGVDGLLDPFIGRLSDNWRSRWGRRLPFMTIALPPMMIASALLFTLPANLAGGALFAYVLALNIVLRVGLSVFALPHSALTAELSDDYGERSIISTYRALFIVLGTAAALLPAFGFLFAEDGALQTRPPYQWLGLMTACLIGGFGSVCVGGIFKTVRRLPMPPGEATGTGFLSDMAQLFRNPSFVPMFGGAVLVLVGQGATTALNLHAYRYFWELPSAYMQLPLLVLPLGMLLGTLAAGLLLRRIEKRDGVVGAITLLGVYQIVITLLAVTGVIPAGSMIAVVLVAISGLLFGGCGALCFVCFYSMIADAVDEHDHLFGVRREALYAAALMVGAKAATGLGAFLSGLGLQLIGFVAPAKASGIVPPDIATSVGLLWGLGGALVVLAAIPFLRRYRIDRSHHAAVLESLAARNADHNTAPNLTPDLAQA
ncbi:major facilitator superfamily MFS_1 [Sphingopyxis sp. EG6]|nr:major facilitator superfamily MFS_1 [Sphingopyxis sp. EG6]